MFVQAIKRIRKTMFPIFRIDQLEQGGGRVGVVGTGFFVSANGNFISVAHVFDNSTDKTKFFYFGRLPDNVEEQIEIEEVARDNENDIFVGRVKKKTPDYLFLSGKLADVGRTVCIAGYPLATMTANAQGALDVSGVRRYFQPSYVLDHAKTNSSSGSGTIRAHDGFLVRDVGLFGMSGGPVFDTAATVVGIQGSVTKPRESVGSDGRKIAVENAMVIKSPLILDFVKQKRIRMN